MGSRTVLVGVAVLFVWLSAQGVAAAPVAPEPVSPGSQLREETVAEGCPTFSWSVVPDAASYELVVYEVRGRIELGDAVIRRRLSAGVSSWTPSLSQGLAPGSSYAWTVGAEKGKSETRWSDPAFFKVARGASSAELEEALRIVRSYLAAREEATDPVPTAAAGETAGTSRSTAPESAAELAPPPGTQLNVDGTVHATGFSGGGSLLTDLDPASFSTGTAAIDISGTATTASNLVGGASVSVSELEFDPATQSEHDAHASAADAHREHATLEESSEIDSDIATHAGLTNVHHAPTVDTDTVLTEEQVEGYVTDDTLDMGNHPITNIGAAGTDFTSSGGLTVGDDVRINADLGIGTAPLPGTERNIYMYDGGIYSDPGLYISGHNSGQIQLERRRVDGGTYTLRSGCGSVYCADDFSISKSGIGNCIAIRDGCDVDIPTLEVDTLEANPTDSPGTCSSTTEGRFYYDASLDEPCFCNGSEWRQFDGGGTC